MESASGVPSVDLGHWALIAAAYLPFLANGKGYDCRAIASKIVLAARLARRSPGLFFLFVQLISLSSPPKCVISIAYLDLLESGSR
jgi:hypothetical protein